MISQSYSHWIQFSVKSPLDPQPHEVGVFPNIHPYPAISHIRIHDIPIKHPTFSPPFNKHPSNKAVKFHLFRQDGMFGAGLYFAEASSKSDARRICRTWLVEWDVGFTTDSAYHLRGWCKSLKIMGKVEKVDENIGLVIDLSSGFESPSRGLPRGCYHRHSKHGSLSSPRTNIASPTRTMSLLAAIGFTTPLLTSLSGSS